MTTLETLLVAIRDGTAAPGALARARALASEDERIPEELRGEVLREPDDASADAAGLLAVLGADDLGERLTAALFEEIGASFGSPEIDAGPDLAFDDAWEPIGALLREGLREEADGIELADAVMRRIPLRDFPWGPVLADAIISEAGAADIAQGVLSVLTPGGAQLSIAAAIEAEAGQLDVSSAVMSTLDLGGTLPVAEAVRFCAGTIDITDRVMLLVAPDVSLPAQANNRFVFASLLMAAMALFVVIAGRLATPIGGASSHEPIRFARASEVIVEDLNYSSDVQVMVIEGDDGAVILWFDEEA